MQLPLEIFTSGKKRMAELRDLSRTGMFVHVGDPPPPGSLVHVALADDGRRCVTSGHVAHVIDDAAASALGRRAGIGLALRPATRPNDELFARAVERLLAPHEPPAARRIAFCGELDVIGLPALLTMFEHERTSGQLVLRKGHATGWIDLDGGRIANARSTQPLGDPCSVVMSLLDWTDGHFELSTRGYALPACEPSLPITHVLLEHARRRDEASRRLAI